MWNVLLTICPRSAWVVFSCLLAGILGLLQIESGEENQTKWKLDPHVGNFIGTETCVKCHKEQLDQLRTTKHNRSFETLHRTAEAKTYCKTLGLRTVKRSARCVRCHYIPVESNGKVKAREGIGCENCHGPAKEWYALHNLYGDMQTEKVDETAGHREWRISTSIDLGMRHPSNVFLLARSCYSCHFVDDSELVNSTGHTAFTVGFNMISFSQGRMRHNFYRTQGQSNAVSDIPRQRLMYGADLIAGAEFGIRASTQIADHRSRYAKGLTSFTAERSEKLRIAAEKTQNPLLIRAHQLVAEFDANSETLNPQQRLGLSSSLQDLGFEFGAVSDLSGLENLDNLLPTAETYVQ